MLRRRNQSEDRIKFLAKVWGLVWAVLRWASCRQPARFELIPTAGASPAAGAQRGAGAAVQPHL
jgi:hypothetical protein